MKIRFITLFLAGFLLSTMTAPAADSPHIGYVFPAGGQQGTTFVVEVGGQFLESAESIVVTGEGVSAVAKDYRKLMTLREIRQAKGNIKRSKAVVAEASGKEKDKALKRIEKLESTLAMQDPARVSGKMPPELKAAEEKRQLNPQLSERLMLEVTIASDASDGERELRLITADGVSNPIFFHVGTLPESTEVEPNDDHMAAGLQEVSLPLLINGQILPGDMDHFRFKAQTGDQLVVDVSARKLIPYLADAVPGWFQATLTLYDDDGVEVAFADDYKLNPDPVLFYDIPADGYYTLKIRDSIYRGREDFVYRLSVGKLPFITSIFPLGWKRGEEVEISLSGKNLPQSSISGQLVSREAKVKQVTVKNNNGVRSNPVSFVVGRRPEIFEVEPNEKAGELQPVTLPVVVNGRVQKAGDRDVFRFKGSAGQSVALEVHARRLNSPLDSVLRLYDSQWNELATNDDFVDRASGLTTHHADSYLIHELPADGEYYVVMADTQQHGSAEHAYRLRIETAMPDFDLRLEPSGVDIAPGGTATFTAHALRKDGFSGEIELFAEDLPRGFFMSKAVISKGSETVRFTITAGDEFAESNVRPRVFGSASLGSKRIKREALAVDDQMQAFLYRHLVPADELILVPADAPPLRFEVRLSSAGCINLPLNEEVTVDIDVSWNRRNVNSIELVLDNPPEGIELIRSSIKKGRDLAEVVLKATKPLEAGFEDNLILNAELKRGKASVFFSAPAVPIRVMKARE